MRRWYEGRSDKPDIEKNAPKKKGFALAFSIIWREFFGLLKLNLLFIITALPVVTLPAALTAMSRITATMVRDENYFLWEDYWRAFKRDFGKSLLVGFAYILIIILLLSTAYFYYFLYDVSKLFTIIAGIIVMLALMIWVSTFYCFTMLSLVDLPVGKLVKNALVLTAANWKGSVIALLLALLLTVLGLGCFPLSVLFVVLIEFSLTSLLTTLQVYPIIEERVMEKPQEEDGLQQLPEEVSSPAATSVENWKNEDFE